MESLNKEDYEAKQKVFYGAMITAWLNTKLERDKQLLGLSVTAVGLLVTLLRTVGVSDIGEIILFSLAMLAFLVTIISVIYILDANAEYIEEMLASSEIYILDKNAEPINEKVDSSESENKKLTYLDRIAGISFVVGMVIIVIIGMETSYANLSKKGMSMTQEKPSDKNHQSGKVQDSWNGIAKLRPQPPQTLSPVNTTPVQNPSPTSKDNGSSKAG
jgi:hypothetical protein